MTMRVKEQFNIFRDGRNHTAVPQHFALQPLIRLAKSPVTQERIRLNEATGYFGHKPRKLTGKIAPEEMEVVVVDGKPVVLHLEPVVRTVYFDVDEAGNVTHEQEFLDTEFGRKCYSLYMAGHGGFSWAMTGNGQQPGGAQATLFAGFDYVDQPNFIPLERQQQLLSSLGAGNSMLLSSIGSFNCDKPDSLLTAFQAPANDGLSELLLSSLIEQRDTAERNREQLLDKLPFFLDAGQRQAFIRMESAGDVEVVTQLLSSIAGSNLGKFPHSQAKPVYAPPVKQQRSELGAYITPIGKRLAGAKP